MKRAQELDPLMPAWTGWLGALYMYQGRHEEAIAEARKALEMLPRFPVGLYVLGESYKAQGNYEEAIAVHEQAAEISPAWRWPLGHTYAVAGRRDEALKIAAELEKEDRFALGLAEVYVALDRKDDAFRCLETSIEYRHNWVPWLEVFPNLKPLRDDPRFHSLLRRMNFPE